ncbi:hypothetical protein BGC07_08565 [Piscirickettsia litoralis]|uniref:Hemolysin D n=1 Tax=Piscirickettsia litoralis TaxID=1891921 RepID=A0ABX3A3E4_9GAMM|nr:hypothetical protein BGC07_08565 [Piscirickettsia litoralis]
MANLRYGKRQPELNQIKAKIKQAEAQLIYANKQLKRYKNLIKAGATQQETLDSALEEAKIAQNNVYQTQSELVSAALPARKEQIQAAIASQHQAQSTLERAQWVLEQKQGTSPINGYVFDIYYRLGEQIPANRPVLSILSPKNIKIIFFISAQKLPTLHLNQIITVSTATHPRPIQATIDYISSQAEYTPPVLYTQKQSTALVFRIEARFSQSNQSQPFHPGQPVEVHYAS